MLSNFTTKKSQKAGDAVSATSMLSKLPPPSSQDTPQPGGDARPGEPSPLSIIAREVMILGNLLSKGEVQVEGEVQGDVHGTRIAIGKHARITGGIVADEVIVGGQVLGPIRSKKVVLQSSSHVEGDIYHQSLAIEQGAYFEGKSRRCEDPNTGIARPDAARMQGSGVAAQPGPAMDGPIPLPPASDA